MAFIATGNDNGGLRGKRDGTPQQDAAAECGDGFCPAHKAKNVTNSNRAKTCHWNGKTLAMRAQGERA